MHILIYQPVISFTILFGISITAYGQSPSQKVLEEIQEKGKASHSSAIIIIDNGKILVQEYYGKTPKPEYIASAGKSLTSLAIGKLIDQGKIKSLDEPVCDFYPEWKQGTKKDITIRMLLNHTSGMQNVANASVELEPPPDYQASNIVQLALCAEVSNTPGSRFSYNNKAVALLGGIVEKASGLPFDKYFEQNFYQPMGITHYDWVKDKAGNATTHGAFVIEPMDLAKFGLLMVNDGYFKNKSIISGQWIKESEKPGQSFDLRFGLLWWRLLKKDNRVVSTADIRALEAAHVDAEVIAHLKNLENDTLQTVEFNKKMAEQFGSTWYLKLPAALAKVKLRDDAYRDLIQSQDAVAYYADGFRGNYLVIIPSRHIVAVRVRGPEDDYNPATDDFDDFVELVSKL